jgi:hypothetical protein
VNFQPAKMRTTARGGRAGAIVGRGNVGRATAALAVAPQQGKGLANETPRMSEEALEPGQNEHEAREERQRELVHREKTRERAREGVMTREERLLGEMRATTVARERRMEVERERKREHVQEIVRMRAREREVGVSCWLTARTFSIFCSPAHARALSLPLSHCPALSVPLAFSLSLSPPLHPSSPPASLSPPTLSSNSGADRGVATSRERQC